MLRIPPPALDVPAQDLQRRAQRTRQKRPVWESRAAMSAAYRHRAALRDWRDEPFRAFISGGARVLPDGRAALKCHPQTEAAFYEIRDRLPIAKYLLGLPGDWLLLLADYPGCQRLADPGIRRFRQLVPGAVVKPIGKGSHFLPMEHPEDVLAAAQTWLDARPV